MKKTTLKKLLALALVVCMLVPMTTALAADTTNYTITVTITNGTKTVTATSGKYVQASEQIAGVIAPLIVEKEAEMEEKFGSVKLHNIMTDGIAAWNSGDESRWNTYLDTYWSDMKDSTLLKTVGDLKNNDPVSEEHEEDGVIYTVTVTRRVSTFGGGMVVTPPSDPTPDTPDTPDTPVVPDKPIDTSAPTVSTETTENEDGSTTTTETKQDGVVVETTTNTDGSKTETATKTETVETTDGKTTTTTSNTTKTETDGTTTTEVKVEETVETATGTTTTSVTEITSSNGSTGTTTVDTTGQVKAEVIVTEKAVNEAEKAGASVTLPMPPVAASTEKEKAPVVTVKTGSKKAVAVEIPVAEGTSGAVAVIVKADGTEEIVTKTAKTEKGLAVKLEDGATVKVVDNSKKFDDAEKHWGKDAIDFATSRELFNGVSETKFQPDGTMTRAMLVTVLHRLEGKPEHSGKDHGFKDVAKDQWYSDAVTWANENGIVEGTGNGFDPDGEVTREQIAVILHRYAEKQEMSTHHKGDLNQFHDHHETSDWAREAKEWAVGAGLIGGKGNGRLDPAGDATRTEVATILARLVAMMVG